MRRVEVKRHMAPGEVAVVTDLIEAATRADGHPALADHQWLDLVHGGRAGFAGLVAWESGHDHPVAYAQVSRGNASWALELIVDPHHRYDTAAIGPELLAAAIEVVREEGGGHVHWWVFEPTATHAALAAGIGLAPGRLLHQMRRPLPLPDEREPALATRPFVPGQDEEAWLAVNNRAFASHPEQGGWDLEVLRAREEQDWFDPAGFLLHEDDEGLAGFCWTKVHPGPEPMGEIYVIAVDPRATGRGLGRALTVAGLHHLHAVRAMPTAMLYVDADNTAAVGLYRSLGFTVDHSDRAFVGDVG